MKTEKEIADEVESWNWNLSIFEIYDEIRDNHNSLNEKLLTYAYHFFKEGEIKKIVIDGVNYGETPMISELASFLGVEIDTDATLVGGRIVNSLSPVWSE